MSIVDNPIRAFVRMNPHPDVKLDPAVYVLVDPVVPVVPV